MIWAFVTGMWGRISALPYGVKMAVMGAVIVAMALMAHKCAVSDAVKADRETSAAHARNMALDAYRKADVADADRRAAAMRDDEIARKAIEDEKRKNPEAVKSPAGHASRAVAGAIANRVRD